MNDDNPYAPPQAKRDDDPYPPPQTGFLGLELTSETWPLADRGTRFASALVDGLIGLAVNLPLLYLLGYWEHIGPDKTMPIGLKLTASALGFVAFLLIHGYFLKTNGQTVGKALTGIRIARLDGGVPSFGTIILLRYLPISLVGFIPVAGGLFPLLDVLFIFRADRRCIHDLIAGTQVLKATR